MTPSEGSHPKAKRIPLLRFGEAAFTVIVRTGHRPGVAVQPVHFDLGPAALRDHSVPPARGPQAVRRESLVFAPPIVNFVLDPRESGQDRRSGRGSARAFTLPELLLVLAVMAVLAALMLPSVHRAREQARTGACLDNLKTLGLAAQLYAADNAGLLVENQQMGLDADPWVSGNMQDPQDATNAALVRASKLYPYVNEPRAFRCPAETATPVNSADAARAPRARSYAMNSWIGSRYMEHYPRLTGFRTFMKEDEFAVTGAADVWQLVDEAAGTLDDGWFLVTMDDSAPFVSLPAARHAGGYALGFADGHAGTIKLRGTAGLTPEPAGPSALNLDWIQLKQMTTAR